MCHLPLAICRCLSAIAHCLFPPRPLSPFRGRRPGRAPKIVLPSPIRWERGRGEGPKRTPRPQPIHTPPSVPTPPELPPPSAICHLPFAISYRPLAIGYRLSCLKTGVATPQGHGILARMSQTEAPISMRSRSVPASLDERARRLFPAAESEVPGYGGDSLVRRATRASRRALASRRKDEKQMLHHMVRERQLMNERIAILFPQKRQAFGSAQGLTQAGMEVEVPKRRSGNNALPTHDSNSSRPKLMAFHSAKGLMFDSVLMPRLVSGSFQRVSPARQERLVFVALTRATKRAYLSTSLDNSLPLFQKLLPLEQTRQLSVRRGEHAGTPKPAPATAQPAPDNKPDFL